MPLRPLFALTAIALLAACGKSADTNRTASGEVLEGTISDSMLPLDKVTSQPPLAAPSDSGKGAKPGKAGKPGSGATAANSASGDADAVAPSPASDAPAAATGQ